MKVFNHEKMKEFIQRSGTKQKRIAEKAGISEATLSQKMMVLQGVSHF